MGGMSMGEAASFFGKISHEDSSRLYFTELSAEHTRKSPTVRIKINFSANAKCQLEKNLRLFLTIARQMIILL